MAVTINADTSNGLVMTPDTSGEIKLQSAGTDIATVSSSGITMASGKTLPASALTGTIPTANMPTGSILQVVNVEFSSQVTATNSTFQDTGLEASITPSSTSSKIFVLVNAAGVGKDTNNTWAWFRILKNGSSYKTAGTFHGYTGSTSPLSIGSVVSSTLDSPNTTSPLTYKLQIATGNSNNAYMNIASGNDRSSITLMEVAG